MAGLLAPVVVFAYNRADKLENCIKHLEKCKEVSASEIYVFCDGARDDTDLADVKEVQEFAQDYSRRSTFCRCIVNAQEKNRGLAESIITGVTEVVNRSGKVIVVEDDLVVIPTFLKYMNEALDFYQEDMECGSVCSFSYPMKILKKYDKDVYFTYKADCWGWATWSNRWNNAVWADTDFDNYLSDKRLRWQFESLEAGLDRLMYLQYKGHIDSWAVRWIYYLFRKGQLSVYPTRSQVINDGFDGSGTHISDGFGDGFNTEYNEEFFNNYELTGFGWEKCAVDEDIAKECARFPRRVLPLYVLETLRFMLKRR